MPFGTQGSQDYRKKLTEMLTRGALDTSPVQHWSQGANRMAQALLAGLEMRDADTQNREADAWRGSVITGGNNAAPPPMAAALAGQPADTAPTTTLVGGNPDYGSAISSIESGGKYDALGPVTKTGDRAYGKYQVMGANIGPWSKQHIGQEVTPEQFLQNPKMQDAVFKGQFGQYAAKHGPQGAARAWFAGEGGMNDPNRKDQLGTTVAAYQDKFNAALPPGAQLTQGTLPPPQPQQMAQADPLASAPPNVRAAIVQGLKSTNPQIRKEAFGLAQQYLKPETTDDTKEYNLSKRDPNFKQYMIDMKKAGAQNTVINNTVNPILKGVGDRFVEDLGKAKAASNQISTLHEARKQLDQGAITGQFADQRLMFQKIGALFGMSADQIANTETFQATMGGVVLDLVKGLGTGSGISNADREYAERIAGGQIKLEESSIRRLLDIGERAARARIKGANQDADRLLKSQPKEFEGISALMKLEEPPQYTAPTAPQGSTKPVRRFNPATGKIE